MNPEKENEIYNAMSDAIGQINKTIDRYKSGKIRVQDLYSNVNNKLAEVVKARKEIENK